MHDLRFIRENPSDFDAAMARRGLDAQSPDILKLDEQRRAVQTELQDVQAARNEKSKEIGKIKSQGGDPSTPGGSDAAGALQAIMDEVSAMKDKMGELEERERALAADLEALLSGLPNIMFDDVVDGEDEDDNVEVRTWGEIKSQSGPDHVDIGEKLGMVDFETAAKMSGARFTLLSGPIARMERALVQFFLDTHTAEHGYTETSPPLLVRDNALYGTGQLPKFSEDLFKTDDWSSEVKQKALSEHIEQLNLKSSVEVVRETLNFMRENPVHWLIPTSEVPLTNIVADLIVEEEYLPRRYTAFTPCFRSEAGSSGKDTRGMLRQHQFYKVEMVSITAPEKSEEEHERMTQCAEAILKKLELPFRTVMLCSGDTGFGAKKTYDLEVWLPGQETYREISSVSNCGDFQARRMNARCRPKGEKKTRFVHTLNGSGVAVGRALIAVMENYYDPSDGGIWVPEVLKPYMGGIEKIVGAE